MTYHKTIIKRNTLLFVFVVFVLAFFTLWVFDSFKTTESNIKNDIYDYLIKEVTGVSKNIECYLKTKFPGDIYEVLKTDESKQQDINLYLHSFLNVNFKNIFLVRVKNGKFNVIADGSNNEEDRFEFNEKFEPLLKKYWKEVIEKKRPVYFKQQIEDIWMTYLYPIMENQQVKYILVIDFSLAPIKMIDKNLTLLKRNLKVFLVVMALSILIFIYFSFYDYARQRERDELIEQLKELNETLEERVKEEVEKNREKEKQLMLQSRLALMGELLSMIAHQWRQPLNVIGLIVSNLKLDLSFGDIKKDDLQKQLDKMQNIVNHLSETIDNFRRFYRNENEKSEVRLKDLINEALLIIKPILEHKNIDLKVDVECDEPVQTYPNELKQVLLNIIRNAEDILIEREISDKKIEIKAYKGENSCIIEISDNAGGIDKEIINKIFEPYFTTKDEKNGTGLGLYMSKQILERLNGKLSAYNNPYGATFKIELKVGNG